MKIKLIAAALAVTLTAASGAAIAQDAPPPPPPGGGGILMRADANKDGVVTRAEFLTLVDARFNKMDANHDGKLTADERPQGRMGGRRGGRRMEGNDDPRPEPVLRADTNGDKVITLDEHRAQALKLFTFLDRNNDGKIDKAERETAHDAMMAMGGPGRDKGMRGGHGGHRRHGPPPAGAPEAPPGK